MLLVRTALFFLFLFITCSSEGQIRQEWVNADTSLIGMVRKLDKNNTSEIEKFFVDPKYPNPRKNLGFGWSTFQMPVDRAGGYTSVYADLYYYHDTVKAYILRCDVPHDSLLWDKYLTLYWDVFTPDSNAVFYYRYNEQVLLRPLKGVLPEIDSSLISQKLAYYMSPSSGTTYGDRGGIGDMTLTNRRLFNEIKNSLSESQLITLMCAVNPASRFTAIEYYLRNRKRFSRRPEVDAWIKKVFAEVPMIETMSGCIMHDDKSRDLVYKFAKMKREP